MPSHYLSEGIAALQTMSGWKSYTLAESLMKTLNVETLLADVEHL